MSWRSIIMMNSAVSERLVRSSSWSGGNRHIGIVSGGGHSSRLRSVVPIIWVACELHPSTLISAFSSDPAHSSPSSMDFGLIGTDMSASVYMLLHLYLVAGAMYASWCGFTGS